MLGTSSWGLRAATAALAAGALSVSAGCVRNIDQDSKSGKDYRYKGAKKIELEDGEGKAKGIVTYPGGDRVDWKYFEIPEGTKGKAEIRLKHLPPRPGLDVAMNVYTEWGDRIGRAKPSIKRARRTKRVKLRDLEPGKYYVQVYAPRRTDAGEYRLRVRFKAVAEVAQVDLDALRGQIPDPPTLPAPIEPKVETPEEKAAREEAERLAAEEAEKKAAEEAARLANAPKPTVGMIVGFQMSSGDVIITINRGKSQAVERGWTGEVLQGGSSGSPMPGGKFQVIRVTGDKSIGKVKLSLDVIRSNPYVRLSPPAP